MRCSLLTKNLPALTSLNLGKSHLHSEDNNLSDLATLSVIQLSGLVELKIGESPLIQGETGWAI